MILCVFERFQAINSLNKYPLPLQTAKEAKILQHFGDGICKILDDKLQRYYRENGIYNMCVNRPKRHSRIITYMLFIELKYSSTCRSFALFSPAGQNASIHSLPKGALSFDKSDNNTLAPTTKVNCVPCLIYKGHFHLILLYLQNIIRVIHFFLCRRAQLEMKGKKRRKMEAGKKRENMCPRKGQGDTLCWSLFTDNHRWVSPPNVSALWHQWCIILHVFLPSDPR